jgi:hypothetical protein
MGRGLGRKQARSPASVSRSIDQPESGGERGVPTSSSRSGMYDHLGADRDKVGAGTPF